MAFRQDTKTFIRTLFAIALMLIGASGYNRALAEIKTEEQQYVDAYTQTDTALAIAVKNRVALKQWELLEAQRKAQEAAAQLAADDAATKAEAQRQAELAAQQQQALLQAKLEAAAQAVAQKKAQQDALAQQQLMTQHIRVRTTRAS